MDEILTRQEASKFLKIPLSTLNFWVSTNQVPFSRLGRKNVRFLRARLVEWAKEREGIEFRHAEKGE